MLLGISRRGLERLRSSGKNGFPHPDMKIGRRLLWKPQSIQDWINQ
jgi:hypothetical protein